MWIMFPSSTRIRRWDSHRRIVSSIFSLREDFGDSMLLLMMIFLVFMVIFHRITRIDEELVEYAVLPDEGLKSLKKSIVGNRAG